MNSWGSAAIALVVILAAAGAASAHGPANTEHRPEPAGTYTSRLTCPSEVADGVRVTLLPGRVPGLLVQSSSQDVLTVFAENGEPFLRISPIGVEANVKSAAWWESGRSGSFGGPPLEPTLRPEWRRVAQVPRFAWVEPRAAHPNDRWEVPMQLGDQRLLVTGIASWRPPVPEG